MCIRTGRHPLKDEESNSHGDMRQITQGVKTKFFTPKFFYTGGNKDVEYYERRKRNSGSFIEAI